jgi:hypothetical protein
MDLLNDVGQMEDHFAQFAPNMQLARKSFCADPKELRGDVGQVEAHFGLFRDSVNLGTR